VAAASLPGRRQVRHRFNESSGPWMRTTGRRWPGRAGATRRLQHRRPPPRTASDGWARLAADSRRRAPTSDFGRPEGSAPITDGQ
jgi:hypothetical protein